ncbi:MAG TPA: peptidase T [Bacteroidota bacterium]|nr:peptidase T [Bacteroidota bacterium]
MNLTRRYIVFLALLFSVYYSFAQSAGPKKTVVERFLKYVKIDTQSKDDMDSIPSTRKQFDLAKVLVEELKELGLGDARVDDHCYVYATLATNLPASVAAKVPVIGLISHMDTSPEVSGANVNAIIHYSYAGGDIRLPNDTTQVITVAKNPRLKDNIGSDIITADGTTLLGADDKAGCSEIMTVLQTLINDPSIKHGTIKIAFTPDEEVGTGAHGFDVKGFGAQYAYTIDGGQTGEISNETWNADEAKITIKGKNTHPGTAKGIMNNSLYPMAYFLSLFPPNMKPETTEKRVGFLHPYSGTVEVEESKLKVLLRDFDIQGLEKQRKILSDMKAKTLKKFPKAVIDIDIKETYRNMKLELDKVPFVTDYAIEACKRAGVKVDFKPVRGGTDGSQLTYNGLPCPNIFTGGENFHGKLEWIPVQGMEKGVKTILSLIQIWVEKNS